MPISTIGSLAARSLAVLVALLIAITAVSTASVAHAQDDKKKLRWGDDAPELEADWLSDIRPDFIDGVVYLVLFWSDDSVASKKALLQLWELQERYSGQVGIVLMVNEKLSELEGYLDARGIKHGGVPIGADKNKSSWNKWMTASGQKSNLAIFIVNGDKKVVWGGDPGDPDLLRVLPRVLIDRYDPVAEAKAQPALEAARRAGKIRNYRDSYLHYDTAISVNPRLFSDIALEKYKFMVTDARDPQAGATYGKSLLETYADDGSALIDLANMIVSDPDIKERDTELADAAVKRMLALSAPSPRPTDPSLLSRYAAFQFATGKVREAVDSQMEAWMVAPESAKSSYKIKLDQYRNALKTQNAGGAGGAGAKR
jgi:hypothetical protein